MPPARIRCRAWRWCHTAGICGGPGHRPKLPPPALAHPAIRSISVPAFSGLHWPQTAAQATIVVMGEARPCADLVTKLSRRRVLSFLATGAVAAGFLGAGAPRGSFTADATTMTADEALPAKLKAGNRGDFFARRSCVPRIWRSSAPMWQGAVSLGDGPHVLNVRVSPELIFGGVRLGELFVVRNARQYGRHRSRARSNMVAEHLGAPLVVVLGHQRWCG